MLRSAQAVAHNTYHVKIGRFIILCAYQRLLSMPVVIYLMQPIERRAVQQRDRTMHKIYISSTYKDLIAYRESVYNALHRLRQDVVAMEDYGADDDRPLDKCLADVAACDLYVGIFAWRYGYIPEKDNPDQRSITELEYRAAIDQGKPTLIFLLDPSAPWPSIFDDHHGPDNGLRIDALRTTLGKDKTVSFFQDAKDLATKVVTDVSTRLMKQLEATQQAQGLSTTAGPPIVQPREVIYDVLLLYQDNDEAFATEISEQLRFRGSNARPAARVLFAANADDVQQLERYVRECHTAAVVLSDVALHQMADQRDTVRRTLDILQARTGYVVGLCLGTSELERTKEWGFSELLDLSAWRHGDEAQINLLTQIDLAITGHCAARGIRTIGLPCVVIAMTSDEAQRLNQKFQRLSARMSPKTFQKFQGLKAALEQSIQRNGGSLADRYGLAREDWKPFVGSSTTVRTAIDTVISTLHSARLGPLQGRRIKIQFYPFDPLMMPDDLQKDDEAELDGADAESDNDDAMQLDSYGKALLDIYQEIAQNGCLVLADEFSMFLPRFRDAFFHSPLSISTQAALVTVSPFGMVPSDQVIERELRRQLVFAFKRFVAWDPQCEFGIGDEHRLKRWLYGNLPQTLQNLRQPPPDPDLISEFAQAVGVGRASEMPSLLHAKGGRR
jgi:Domain of unknown function (DUF4062)